MIELLAKHGEHMIWVDETATYMDMCRTRGRAAPGVRVKATRRRKYRRHTMIVAMSLEGVVASRMIVGGMKLSDWQAFCREDLAPVVKKGTLIQLDNLDLHEDQLAYDAIYEAGGIFLFQPKYSPESNPIEEAFSQFKRHLRTVGAKTLDELRKAVADGLALITPSHMQAYWRHAQQSVLNW